jgi:hypothetical protein
MLFYLPGALFELILPILLIVKGFRLVSSDPDQSTPRSLREIAD